MDLATAPNNNPLALFAEWTDRARQDDPEHWNGMALATVDSQGQPSCRVVLLKAWDDAGFVFYSNQLSRKGSELAANPRVAATFWWSGRQRSVRIEGQVSKVAAATSDSYFNSRPLGSRLAAVASAQSQPLDSFAALDQAYADVAARHGDQVPRPDHWGGYLIRPERIEFWQGRENRLHHRLSYQRTAASWQTSLLQP